MSTHNELDVRTLLTANLMDLPPTIGVELAGRAFGVGRDTAYKLARADEFPCQVIKAGRSYRVVTADLRRILQAAAPADDTAA